MQEPVIKVIIPAFNESQSIQQVIEDIPKKLVDGIVVVNNASSDATAKRARQSGATVIDQPKRGYGNACLKGIDYLKKSKNPPDIVVFLDADYSDSPDEMGQIVDPIIENNVDLVIGSRALGNREPGAMKPQQIFGNWLATSLMRLFWNAKFTDLGPFRAIKFNKLLELNMQDTTFGWTVEMQVKALKHNFAYTEVPVSYKKRIGVSKISGTINGSIKAGYKILYTIFKNL
ncbi:Glycosyltransferase involved in cell wall bisynthesis [Fodinibius salinus]|uniref:Glycosyltransferase involved in cell wall bisynthesis n=1 Tax=Fodinibius salinus TaxID=860790 RepID=A0A5D3YIF4_9BACT|nr:glycosyltransferase family 2 protein [Fodinibius salinus]TYP92010.1 Glycosyltransferase involved in cell wall bisynthesis [Fodinibius salinus]